MIDEFKKQLSKLLFHGHQSKVKRNNEQKSNKTHSQKSSEQ